MSDFDEDLRALSAQQTAMTDQARSSSKELAQILVSFRTELIVGGFPAERAEDLAADYFAAILDQHISEDEDD